MTLHHPPDQQAVTDLINFLRTHARTAAEQTLGPLKLLEQDSKTLTIGRGTQLETRIVKRTKNHLAIDTNAYNLHLNPIEPPGHSRFDVLWRTFLRRVETALYLELQTHLEILPPETSLREDPKIALLNSPEVTQAVHKVATEIRDSIQSSPVHDPAKEGTLALHKFLGPRRVAKVLSIVGPDATLPQFQYFQTNREVIEQLSREEPNTTVLWFKSNDHLHYRNTGGKKTLIKRARSIFISYCYQHSKYREDLRAQNKATPGAAPLETTLWQTFRSLDTQALKQHSARSPQWETLTHYVKLTDFTLLSDVPPPPWVQTFLLNHPYYLEGNTPVQLVRSFAEETRSTRTIKQQEALQVQLHTLARLHRRYTTNPSNQSQLEPLATLIDQPDHHNPPAWSKLTALLPKGASPAHSPPPQTPRNFNSETHKYLANAPHTTESRLLSSETLHVHGTPGVSIALYNEPTQPPLVLIKRHQDGTISYHRSYHFLVWPQRDAFQFPEPGKEHHPPTLSLARKLDNLNTKRIHDYLHQHWDQVAPFPRTAKPSHEKLATNTYMHTATASPIYAPGPLTSHTLESRLINEITNLLNHEIWSKTKDIAGQVGVDQYNALITLGEHRTTLKNSNPGAFTWALTKMTTPSEPLVHPGQIIAMAKTSLLETGLEPRNWKFTARLPTEVMTKIAAANSTDTSIIILNAAAKAQAPPPPAIAKHIAHIVNQSNFYRPIAPQPFITRDKTQLESPLNRLNTSTMIFLICRETLQPTVRTSPEDELQFCDSLPSVRDYVNHLTDTGLTLRSTTWSGLLKASSKWHHDQNLIYQQQTWQHRLNAKNGTYMAWTSALQEYEKEGFTITPLTDEKQLHFEALHMNHCVHGYGNQCANGSSRIFSISKGEKRIATSELKKAKAIWTPVQTKTKDNHTPSLDIVALMEQVAHDYQQADTTNPNKGKKFTLITELPTPPKHP